MDNVRHTSLRDAAKVDANMSSRSCLGTNFIGSAGVLPAAMSALACSSAFSAATAFYTFLKSSLHFTDECTFKKEVSVHLCI